MRGGGFNFDELGDRLGVDDDDETRDIDRPAPPRRPIGQILQPTPPAPAAIEPPATVTTPPTPTHRRASSTATARRTGRRERGQRSSANLPIGLVDQLARYKQRHRWELSQLIDSALDHLALDDAADPDDVLNAHWHGPRTARHYQLLRPAMDRLDAVGERWRMNRSQAITVLVVLEAHRLGLTQDG